jgi:TetR/AcrR family transcriptional regulator, transcriptional repressor for nem operon
MKSTKGKAVETRDRIIGEAARQFRERGFAGIGVAELMGCAGLTHGGFYAHFSSKNELKELACRRAVSDMLVDWRAKADAAPEDPLGTIVRLYLSREHRDQPGTGCLMAALGPEAAREAEPVRRAVAACLEDVLDTLAAYLPEPSAATRRRQAICIFTALVGAIVVARSVADPSLSDDILRAVAEKLADSNPTCRKRGDLWQVTETPKGAR